MLHNHATCIIMLYHAICNMMSYIHTYIINYIYNALYNTWISTQTVFLNETISHLNYVFTKLV